MNINSRKAEPGDTGRHFHMQSRFAWLLTRYREIQNYAWAVSVSASSPIP